MTNQYFEIEFLKQFNCVEVSKTKDTYGLPSVVHVEGQHLAVNKRREKYGERGEGDKYKRTEIKGRNTSI